MPYYEFECQGCHETFTTKQSFEEHDHHQPVRCPKCGSSDVKPLVTVGFVKTSKKS